LVHVEDVLVAKTFDVFADIHDLLEILILSGVEDGIVDNNAVYGWVIVGGDDCFFNVVLFHPAERIVKATARSELNTVS